MALRRDSERSSLGEVTLPPAESRRDDSMLERKDSETNQATHDDDERLLNLLELGDND
jgi:hypothetical protein